jgi:hypothetical protein
MRWQAWLRTLALGIMRIARPTHGYAPSREVAMAAFARSWRREYSLTRRSQWH